MPANRNQIHSTASVENRSSIKLKSGKNRHQIRPKPLLPQVTGISPNSEIDLGLITTEGLVDLGDEHWTTEKAVDELFYCLARKEPEPDLVTLPTTNDDSYSKPVDLLEQYESSDTLLYRKYIICAEKLAGSHSEDKANIFAINLSDLSERLQAELLDLQITRRSRNTLSRILHSAVARIFALASLRWFYESACEEIQVILEP